MDKSSLNNFLFSRNILIDSSKIDSLFKFMKSTLEDNEKFNLTAIVDEDTFIEKMILDSLLALYDLDLENKKLIDVGTGAGYPGMVIRLVKNNCDITLLDSTKKKIDRLSNYAKTNGLKINAVAQRVEEYSINHKEEYDYVTARAVAHLSILCECIAPMLKVGGCFIAYKGSDWSKELMESKNAFKKLGLSIKKIYCDTLPESGENRAIIHIQKNKQTPSKYPRQYKDIKANKL